MTSKLSKADFLEAAGDVANETAEYLEAVYAWATDYALPMDDAEYILTAAADNYAGHFMTGAEFARSYYESAHSDRLEEIRNLAAAGPVIELSFDWEQMARLVMPNTEGLDYAEFSGHYFWAAN